MWDEYARARCSREDGDAIRNLEDKIYLAERQLREINDLFAKTS